MHREQFLQTSLVTRASSPVQDAASDGQGVRMVRAEHPLAVGQQLAEQAQRFGGVPGPSGPSRDVAPGRQGVGMVRAEHPLAGWQQLAEQPQRFDAVPRLAGPGGDVVPGGQGGRMVRAEVTLDRAGPAGAASEIDPGDGILAPTQLANQASTLLGAPKVSRAGGRVAGGNLTRRLPQIRT